MIKANELRVGNWIQDGLLSYQVGEIEGDFDNANPIPLTPEILENWGLIMWDDKKTYSKEFENGSVIQIRDNEVFLGGQDSCTNGMGFITQCRYVHQLQNLYYALTGEELQIKNLQNSFV